MPGVLLNRDEFSQDVAGSGGCPATVALKGGAAVYESNGDTLPLPAVRVRATKSSRVSASAISCATAKGDKAYANWGRYYNMDQKSSGRSLAPNRIFQTQTVFDLNGDVLSSGPLASTTGKMIDPAIKPIYTDEILVGYATPLGGALQPRRVFHVARHAQLHRGRAVAPERHGAGQRTVRGGQSAVRRVRRLPVGRRAAHLPRLDGRRAPAAAGGWMSDVSYTWSRFEGNFDLDYSAGRRSFNTSSFIQDGPGTNVEDPNRFGPLFEDRPHVFKVFTSYAATSG